MKFINGDDVNELCLKAHKLIKEEGMNRTPPVGKDPTREVRKLTSTLSNPKARYLFLNGRTSSIYAAIAETFWVMSGSDVITGWLEWWLHRAKLYSDNGVTWNRGYGPMLYKHNQLSGCIKYLYEDLNTRHSVLSIYDASEESYDSCVNKVGHSVAKDKSCNNLIYFSTHPETGNLELSLSNRSNDILFGAYSINLFEFTFIQEFVADLLNIELGDYSVFSNNTHTYLVPHAEKQFNAVIEGNNLKELNKYKKEDFKSKLIKESISNIEDIDYTVRYYRSIFKVICNNLLTWKVSDLSQFLIANDLHDTKIAQYCMAMMAFVYYKRDESFTLDVTDFDLMFADSIKNSVFTKFGVKDDRIS